MGLQAFAERSETPLEWQMNFRAPSQTFSHQRSLSACARQSRVS